ncbi:Pentatricopeptide repeat-containing protein [Dendrobium catenatum]|uniref:Pentatricopeptide repeat-containing protein n=2 Tax=Dendrobium catenatum TaxID=906689 RepID=A0A2I0WMY4_9ASPA|nr:Pentatricopeptide repeat-containing protein [Dendrobium catenatum]
MHADHCGAVAGCCTMAMPLPRLVELPLAFKILPFRSSPPPIPRLPTLSSLRLLLRRSKTLTLPLFSAAQDAISVPQDPIFLRHLQRIDEDQLEDKNYDEDFEEGLVDEDDLDLDPIRSFFKSRKPVPDPKHEGGRAWHIADIDPAEASLLDEEEQTIELESAAPLGLAEDGVVGDILRIARNLPENSALGDFLDSFVGKIGESECIELLARMGEDGLAWSCLYLFEWMRLQEPSLVTSRACSVVFPVLGKAGMGEKLMILFENLPRAKQFRDVRLYNAAISGLSCCGRYDDAWGVFEAMETNNIQPDHVTCSILVTTMRKSGRCAKDVWDFFERLNRKGVKWSPEVSGALIKTFCDEGLKKEALIIQSEMEKNGITSNVIIYNTLMDAYGKSNQIEEVEGLLNEMKMKGLKPTTSTYNILMDAYSRRMQPEIVEDLLLEMQTLGLKPNVKSYTCLISAYGRQKKMSEKAADSFLRMKAAGINPTSHSYTALIHAFSVSGWHEKAYSAYQRMEREGITPSIETYTALLDAFRRAGETKMLMEIWKTMILKKVEGTKVTFYILLDGFAKHGLYVQARDVISEFGKFGIQPTVMTYNILMNAYARGGQHYRLPQLLKEMAALELKPDSVTYSTMIYAYLRVRDFTRAFYYHKQMIRSGKVPEASSYHKLRAILDAKAATKNIRDRSAILGIVNSKMGLKPKKGKKDEFWKNKKRRSIMKNLSANDRY